MLMEFTLPVVYGRAHNASYENSKKFFKKLQTVLAKENKQYAQLWKNKEMPNWFNTRGNYLPDGKVGPSPCRIDAKFVTEGDGDYYIEATYSPKGYSPEEDALGYALESAEAVTLHTFLSKKVVYRTIAFSGGTLTLIEK